MKTIKIMILSLLVASQAFAWSKSETNALLGFGAGIIVSQIIDNHNRHDNNYNTHTVYKTKVIHQRPHKIHKEKRHYNERKYTKRHHGKHYSKHAHKKHHNRHTRRHHHRDNVVVVNRYRNHYYY